MFVPLPGIPFFHLASYLPFLRLSPRATFSLNFLPRDGDLHPHGLPDLKYNHLLHVTPFGLSS